MSGKTIPEGAEAKKGTLQDITRVLQSHAVLLLGSIAWWGSHYLLLWNAHIAAIDSFISGYDGRFVLSVVGTIFVLGILAFIAWRRPQFELATKRWFYIAFAVCAALSLGFLIMPLFVVSNFPFGAIGAVLSGVGNSFMLILYGELHVRMGIRFMPLMSAMEVIAGVVLSFALSFLPVVMEAFAAAILIVTAAILYSIYAGRTAHVLVESAPVKVDMTLRPLLVFAVLTGFAYGLVRTFAIGGLEEAGMHAGLEAERWGTCLCAFLLVVVFFLQNRQTLFEQCLLMVLPLVATGMLLVSLQGVGSVVPTAINTGGFACFFNLMWYFAAVLTKHEKREHITLFVALLFFSSQSGQLLGALVPAQFSNSFSSALIYLLLLLAMLFMYWRSKISQSVVETEHPTLSESVHEPMVEIDAAQTQEWIRHFGFSPREAEIVTLLVRRTPYKQIGEELYVSGNTVKTHVRNIYRKADVTSREELLEKLNTLAKKG